MKRMFIQTIGCQMNVYDAGRVAALLAPMGYRQTADLEEADLVVVHTCTIREKAEQKAYSFLGRLTELKRGNPALVVAVGGCLAQQEAHAVFRRASCVDIVFGTRAIERLPGHVATVARRRRRVVDVDMADGPPDSREKDPAAEISAASPAPLVSDGEVSRFVTIMRGCDNFCSYCVVPYVRGRETSRPPEDILDEVRSLAERGIREITLLGQNVNSYGLKEGLPSFPELLRRVAGVKGIDRIRFTTSHPKDLSEGLMDAFRDLPNLCPHIHLPVQSGSDVVLRRMNRGYASADYWDKVVRLRKRCPEIAITSDIIVGFPGETAEDFGKTMELIRRVDYDGLFAFKYSDRSLAPASRFGDKVPEEEKSRRLAALLAHQEAVTFRKNRSFLGRMAEVLVDGRRALPGDGEPLWRYTGRTGENRIVHFDDPGPHWHGHLVHVEIIDAFAHSLRGGAPRLAAEGERDHAA